jgi:hypothetical protein
VRFFFYSCWRNEVSRSVPVERRFRPKGGASAQQPKAERASHSAVVRPQAAEKSRSTTSEPVGQPVYRCAAGSLAAALNLPASGTGQFSLTAIGHSPFCWLGMDGFKLGECWFKPTRRGWSQRFLVQRFLVQDRLRASDVLHRDWDWSGWR